MSGTTRFVRFGNNPKWHLEATLTIPQLLEAGIWSIQQLLLQDGKQARVTLDAA